jgi:hypothetical protein
MSNTDLQSKRKRPPNFRWEIPGDDLAKSQLNGKLHQVRDILMQELNRPVNNFDILQHVFDAWLGSSERTHSDGMAEQEPHSTFTPYHEITNDKKEIIFITTNSAVAKVIEITENHARHCSSNLSLKGVTRKGHVGVVKLRCGQDKHHSYMWSSSPYLSNKKYFINYKMAHGFVTSAILPIQLQRFCEAAGIGYSGVRARQQLLRLYKGCVDEEYDESIQEALVIETAMSEDLTEGISVMSDARHGWRKNAKDTSIVLIGEKSHKVIKHKLITKQDDHVSQRHETLGTVQLLDEMNDKNIGINVWIHDRNMSINKALKTRGISNQNDIWHAIKSLKKKLKQVSSGAKMHHGKTWHFELDDKVESVANHAQYATRHSDGSSDTLRKMLDTVVPHYKNDHKGCHSSSRCNEDSNYEPSKKVLTDSRAEKMLSDVISSSVVYKSAEDYALGKETHYVESFNNVLNIFQDKRISFSSETYDTRAKLATLHWNENVDRAYTSEWRAPSQANKRSRTKRNYKATTYRYKQKLWQRFFNKIME